MNRLMLVCCLLASIALPSHAQTEPLYQETMVVARHIVYVRAVDRRGKAILDLDADDFTATIDGKPADVESATRSIGGQGAPKAQLGPPKTLADIMKLVPEPARRSVLIFVLTDFARNPRRVEGQLKFNAFADRILEMLEPQDRVAVASFDSHLKLRLDFTTNRDAIRKAVRDSINTGRVAPPAPGKPHVSLARHLDPAAMLSAASNDSAFLQVSRALKEIEGSKTMILAGWGFGEAIGPATVLPAEWREAVALLKSEKTQVISLNTGLGGTLSAGMIKAAKDTGGMYAHIDASPQQTLSRVEGTLDGTYELLLRTEGTLTPGEHPLIVRVKRKGVTVVAAPAVNVPG